MLLETPPLFLAPMAEITHAPFRRLVAEIGGCGLFYTEMLNARIVATRPLSQDPYCQKTALDRPLIAQIIGNDPGAIARSIERLEAWGADGFDINMGCSRHAILRHGWGAALMADTLRAAEVVRAARKATRRPLFVKLRSGEDHDPERLEAFARSLADLGVDAIVLHPRSVRDGFKRPARWSEVSRVARALSIPVIGNGDITDPEAARRRYAESGCAGLMIGRAAAIRPWIFWEIVHGSPWPGDPVALLQRMAGLTAALSPPPLDRKRFLIFCHWYLRNWPFHHHLQGRLARLDSLEAMADLAVETLSKENVLLIKSPCCARL